MSHAQLTATKVQAHTVLPMKECALFTKPIALQCCIKHRRDGMGGFSAIGLQGDEACKQKEICFIPKLNQTLVATSLITTDLRRMFAACIK